MITRRLPGALLPALLLALLTPCLPAVGPEIPPPPTRWLTDQAGFLSPAAAAELDGRLEAFERASGRQFIVWIGRSTAPLPIEDFAVRAFAAWKVGRRGLDDGLVLFVMAEDRALRFEVGYGMEGEFPDILAGRIVSEVAIPRLQQGDPDGALRAAVEEAIGVLAGGASATGAAPGARPAGGKKRKATPFETALLVLAVIGFIILFITNPQLALWLLWSILSSRGGGGGGGGGGWSGGGGRSGGGGASGRW